MTDEPEDCNGQCDECKLQQLCWGDLYLDFPAERDERENYEWVMNH